MVIIVQICEGINTKATELYTLKESILYVHCTLVRLINKFILHQQGWNLTASQMKYELGKTNTLWSHFYVDSKQKKKTKT